MGKGATLQVGNRRILKALRKRLLHLYRANITMVTAISSGSSVWRATASFLMMAAAEESLILSRKHDLFFQTSENFLGDTHPSRPQHQ